LSPARERRFRDMAGSVPTHEEEYRQLYRNLTEKVLDKAASDPQWKQQLLDEPQMALQAAGFPEIQRLDEVRQSAAPQEEEEVAGQASTLYSACCRCYYYTW
jgi:hypothetical protein